MWNGIPIVPTLWLGDHCGHIEWRWELYKLFTYVYKDGFPWSILEFSLDSIQLEKAKQSKPQFLETLFISLINLLRIHHDSILSFSDLPSFLLFIVWPKVSWSVRLTLFSFHNCSIYGLFTTGFPSNTIPGNLSSSHDEHCVWSIRSFFLVAFHKSARVRCSPRELFPSSICDQGRCGIRLCRCDVLHHPSCPSLEILLSEYPPAPSRDSPKWTVDGAWCPSVGIRICSDVNWIDVELGGWSDSSGALLS